MAEHDYVEQYALQAEGDESYIETALRSVFMGWMATIHIHDGDPSSSAIRYYITGKEDQEKALSDLAEIETMLYTLKQRIKMCGDALTEGVIVPPDPGTLEGKSDAGRTELYSESSERLLQPCGSDGVLQPLVEA